MWDDNLELIEDAEVSLELFEHLVGYEIRLQWPDGWKEAYYTGILVDVEATDMPDTGEVVTLELLSEGSKVYGLILPVEAEINLWEVTQ